ncbi:DNA adenine methylase [Lachnospiraceae bacterium 10-1]|nr:DNA adenine methylase [Lachnospiraceae bacterium 10-1]
MQNKQIVPFLKWPGGKRWLAKKYKEYFPKEYNMYIEPFLGSGAVFFSLQPKEAILSDINKELINLYVIMRDNPKELKGQLVYHQERHTKEHYYKIRDVMLTDNLKCAGRLLYLNRACYNGMYRVNKQGKFNVPIGTKNNFTYDIDQFDQYADCLKHATLICGDFYEIINKAKKNDFIFADPPYATSGKANFTKYNDELFVWQDQLRLHEALVNAKARGAKIVLTNVYCKEIIEMYKNDGFYVHILQRSSNIAGQADKRGKVKELMITSNKKQSKRKEKHE